jgi:hypothetical protein
MMSCVACVHRRHDENQEELYMDKLCLTCGLRQNTREVHCTARWTLYFTFTESAQVYVLG